MMNLSDGFSGSYERSDVTFLLKPVDLAFTDIDTKEAAIQSGRRHYSEMLAPERPPSAAYLRAFECAFAMNRSRVGRDIASLAQALKNRPGQEVVLVSLARAGTPVGVLLKRALTALGKEASHYSVSIIRDRGIDPVALGAILENHRPEDIVFVDGWTGKGAISKELHAVTHSQFPILAQAPLCVLSDLAGVADIAAGNDDYVIPSAILNGVVSGLVSRTVLNDDVIGPGDFHGCVILNHLKQQDLSQYYVNEQMKDVFIHLTEVTPADWGGAAKAEAAQTSATFVETMLQKTGAKDRNRIKPGIGESTRAVLRRVPERVFLKDLEAADVAHLLGLLNERGLHAEEAPWLPYRACAVIQTLGDL